MPIRIEAYTLEGIVTGLLAWPGHLRDALEGSTQLQVERAAFVPLDGRPPLPSSDLPLVVDDVVLAVPDEAMTGPVHAAWHEIALEAGPYRIHGELATLPGFDPGRALTRPTGEFVLIREVRVELMERPEAGVVAHAQGLVNRYNVDFVEADLMLGFFFPGARIQVDAGPQLTGAGADAPTEPAADGSHPAPDGSHPAPDPGRHAPVSAAAPTA